MFNYSMIDESKVEYLDIAPASELPSGERLFVEVEGKSIVIFNVADQYFAIADVCSHDDGPVGEAAWMGTRSAVLATEHSSISGPAKCCRCRLWSISQPIR